MNDYDYKAFISHNKNSEKIITEGTRLQVGLAKQVHRSTHLRPVVNRDSFSLDPKQPV